MMNIFDYSTVSNVGFINFRTMFDLFTILQGNVSKFQFKQNKETLRFPAVVIGLGKLNQDLITASKKNLETINNTLVGLNSHLLLIKDKINDVKIDFSNIKILDDYDVVLTQNSRILIITGDLTYNRKWLIRNQNILSQYNESIKPIDYDNEITVFDENKLKEITSKFDINVLISSSKPFFDEYRMVKNNRPLNKWYADGDTDLIQDFKENNKNLLSIFEYFINNDINLTSWITKSAINFSFNENVEGVKLTTPGLNNLFTINKSKDIKLKAKWNPSATLGVQGRNQNGINWGDIFADRHLELRATDEEMDDNEPIARLNINNEGQYAALHINNEQIGAVDVNVNEVPLGRERIELPLDATLEQLLNNF